jgi:glycosyltransferase involved in cell wall biosynthesis
MRLVPVRPYSKNVSLTRLRSHRDYGRGFERLALEEIAAGSLERPDLILASMPPLEGAEAAATLAQRLDAALVVDLMDLWPETFERALPGPRWFRRLLAPAMLGGLFRRRGQLLAAADGITSSTEAFAATAAPGRAVHLCRLGAYVEQFPIRPHGDADVQQGGGDSTAGSAGRSVPQGLGRPIECVYAASLESGQDLDTLVAAARLLAQSGTPATLHVAGTGSFQGLLESAAASMPSTGSCRIVMHGLLDRGSYARLLSRCDAGLVLVKPETMVAVPYKACDFAAAGLAIINSLPGELAGLLDRYRAGIPYEPGNATSLARAIRELATDPRRLTELGRGARRLAESELSRERIYGRFADWLEGLAIRP